MFCEDGIHLDLERIGHNRRPLFPFPKGRCRCRCRRLSSDGGRFSFFSMQCPCRHVAGRRRATGALRCSAREVCCMPRPMPRPRGPCPTLRRLREGAHSLPCEASNGNASHCSWMRLCTLARAAFALFFLLLATDPALVATMNNTIRVYIGGRENSNPKPFPLFRLPSRKEGPT